VTLAPIEAGGRNVFATIRVYSGSGELADALVENESAVKQLISDIDGFQAYYLVRTADGAASVSVYDNQAGATASDQAARAWVGENLPELDVAPPQVSAGEVVITF
jgi:heme-degrading monooxygenase HmoA